MTSLRTISGILAGGALAASLTLSAGCAPTEGQSINLHGQKVRLTLLHTSDIHSRLFPYEYTPLQPDKQAGLQADKGPYGGIARVSYVVQRERERSDRVIHIDGGDVFQGAPIFNYFNGEAEMKALTMMGVDTMVVANHDFDRGSLNLFQQVEKWAAFPALAANYRIDDPSIIGNVPIGAVLTPYTVINARGLKVGIIGMGNLSTLTSIFEVPNKLGIMPYNTYQIAQFYIDLLRPQVDLIVFVTHLGLEVDQRMIQNTEGIDVVLGGHNHIVISPPQELFDCGGTDALDGAINVPTGDGTTFDHRHCKPRRVLLMHSGAFAKFVGRLDLELTDDAKTINAAVGRAGFYDPVNGFEVISHTQQVIPIDADVPEDRRMVDMLEPYKKALRDVGTLDQLIAYAPSDVLRKAPAGGDSQLGNLVSTSMWLRLGVQTDFAMTNTTGIRSDLPKGPISISEMFNVFPFDNSITKMQLSGAEVTELFDFAARRSAGRACESQVQIAGAFIAINCGSCNAAFRPDYRDPDSKACAEEIFIGYTSQSCVADKDCIITDQTPPPSTPAWSRFSCDTNIGRCRAPISRIGSYEIATNNYLAGGGSGFKVLQRNTTQLDTRIQQRDAVADLVRYGKPCGWTYPGCFGDSDCASVGGTCDFTKGNKDKGIPGACTRGDLLNCTADADCQSIGDFICACPDAVSAAVPADAYPLTCKPTTTCGGGAGRCVMRTCRDDVAAFHDRDSCDGTRGDARDTCRHDACVQAGEQCKILACLDNSIGAIVDGRQVMLGR